MAADIATQGSQGEILLYQTDDGSVRIDCLLMEETLWLTQKAIADLFAVEIPAISKHLSNIYESRELDRQAAVSILETVRQEGSRSVKRKLEHYSLDAIIAVGYRVNSYQATQFRIWATKTLDRLLVSCDWQELPPRGRIEAMMMETVIAKPARRSVQLRMICLPRRGKRGRCCPVARPIKQKGNYAWRPRNPLVTCE